jgi:hypothetical protein
MAFVLGFLLLWIGSVAVIFGIIVAFGSIGRLIKGPVACIWNLTHVFFPHLMILQFIVIAFSAVGKD